MLTTPKPRKFGSLGKRLQALRLAHGYKQKDICAILGGGITSAAVSQWEADQFTPRTEKLRQLAQHFQTTLDWLMHNEGPPPAMPQPPRKVYEPPKPLPPAMPELIGGERVQSDWKIPQHAMACDADRALVCQIDTIMRVDEDAPPMFGIGDYVVVNQFQTEITYAASWLVELQDGRVALLDGTSSRVQTGKFSAFVARHATEIKQVIGRVVAHYRKV